MKYLFTLSILFLLGYSQILQAQDPHFSQFYISPLTLNPALAGMKNGDIRIVGNYRSQWASISNPYQTASIAADMNILNGHIGENLMGVGLVLFNDKAGTSALSRTKVATSIGYSQNLGAEGAYLSVGFEGAVLQRRIQPEKLLFENQFNGEILNPNIQSGEMITRTSAWSFDMTAGLAWSYTPNQSNSYYAGASIAHLTRPNMSFFETNNKLDTKYTVYAGMEMRINGYLSVIPRGVLLKQGAYKEVNIGAFAKIHLESSSSDIDFSLVTGAMYRVNDALIPMVRIDYGAYGLGLTYDINLSKLTQASDTRGGIELAFIYKGQPTRANGSAIPCPDF